MRSYQTFHKCIVPLRIPKEASHSGRRWKPALEVASRPLPVVNRIRMRARPCISKAAILEELDTFRADMDDLQSPFELEAVVLDLKWEMLHVRGN